MGVATQRDEVKLLYHNHDAFVFTFYHTGSIYHTYTHDSHCFFVPFRILLTRHMCESIKVGAQNERCDGEGGLLLARVGSGYWPYPTHCCFGVWSMFESEPTSTHFLSAHWWVLSNEDSRSKSFHCGDFGEAEKTIQSLTFSSSWASSDWISYSRLPFSVCECIINVPKISMIVFYHPIPRFNMLRHRIRKCTGRKYRTFRSEWNCFFHLHINWRLSVYNRPGSRVIFCVSFVGHFLSTLSPGFELCNIIDSLLIDISLEKDRGLINRIENFIVAAVR